MIYRQDEIRRKRQRVYHVILAVLVIVISAVIIWIDLRTGFWGDTVILSGLAAGLLLYFATVFIGDRIAHRSEVDDWLPLTRLALADILHNLTIDELSEGVDGVMVPRSIKLPTKLDDASIDLLSESVIQERVEVTSTIAKWASFLAANADVQDLVLKVADTGSELDDIRLAINAWKTASTDNRPEAESHLSNEVDDYNELIADTVSKAQRILQELRGQDH